MATYPTVDLSHFTPEPTSAKTPTDSVTPTPGLDSNTQKALQTYPLWVGSSWVYEYLGFDQDQEIGWRVVETIVDTQLVDGYFAAQVERTVELMEGSPDMRTFLRLRKRVSSGSYWWKEICTVPTPRKISARIRPGWN